MSEIDLLKFRKPADQVWHVLPGCMNMDSSPRVLCGSRGHPIARSVLSKRQMWLPKYRKQICVNCYNAVFKKNIKRVNAENIRTNWHYDAEIKKESWI